MRLYLNGENLFTIDKMKWADPENISHGAAYYPQSKIYNIRNNCYFLNTYYHEMDILIF